MTPLVFGDVLGGKETFVRCGAHRAFPIVALEHFADSGRLWSVFWSALSRRLAGYPLSGALELGGVVRAVTASSSNGTAASVSHSMKTSIGGKPK